MQNTSIKTTIYNTQQECVDAVESGKVDAMLCDGYLIEHLKRTNFYYNNLQVQRVLSGEYSISMAVRNDNATLADIFKKNLGTIDTKSVNAYMLKENAYPLISITEFIKPR